MRLSGESAEAPTRLQSGQKEWPRRLAWGLPVAGGWGRGRGVPPLGKGLWAVNLRQHRRTGQPGFPSTGRPQGRGVQGRGWGQTPPQADMPASRFRDTRGHAWQAYACTRTQHARGAWRPGRLRRGGVCGGVFSPPLPERPPGGSAVDRHSRFPIRKSSACTRRPCATSQIEQMLIFSPICFECFLRSSESELKRSPAPSRLSLTFPHLRTLGSQRPGWEPPSGETPPGERPSVTSRQGPGAVDNHEVSLEGVPSAPARAPHDPGPHPHETSGARNTRGAPRLPAHPNEELTRVCGFQPLGRGVLVLHQVITNPPIWHPSEAGC